MTHTWTGVEKRQRKLWAGISAQLQRAICFGCFTRLTAHQSWEPHATVCLRYILSCFAPLGLQKEFRVCQQIFLHFCSLALDKSERKDPLLQTESCAGMAVELTQAVLHLSYISWLLPSRKVLIAQSGQIKHPDSWMSLCQLYHSMWCCNNLANCFQADEIEAAAIALLDHQCSWWDWNTHRFSSAGALWKRLPKGNCSKAPVNLSGSVLFKIKGSRSVSPRNTTQKQDKSSNVNSKSPTESTSYVWLNCKGLAHKTSLGNEELSACRHLDVFYNGKSFLNQKPGLHCLSSYMCDLERNAW